MSFAVFKFAKNRYGISVWITSVNVENKKNRKILILFFTFPISIGYVSNPIKYLTRTSCKQKEMM
jgi:hypothetical protein